MPFAAMEVPICFYILHGHFAGGVDDNLLKRSGIEAVSYI